MSIDYCHICGVSVDTDDLSFWCYTEHHECICLACRDRVDEEADAERDIHTIEQAANDLLADYRNPTGHRVICDNARRIEDAADKLALLLEKLRSASTTRAVRSTPINIQAAE